MRRLIAKELILSFVPGGEQRIWRNLTRMELQLIRDRVRMQRQIECLLEEMRIKLSVVVSDLFGSSGLRILHALANGETDATSLALLGDGRLKCTEEQLVEALTGRSHPMHRQMLALQLNRVQLLDEQIAKLNSLIVKAMKLSGVNYSFRSVFLIVARQEGIHYIEQGVESEPHLLIHRAQSLARQLRKFGYNIQITAENSAPS